MEERLAGLEAVLDQEVLLLGRRLRRFEADARRPPSGGTRPAPPSTLLRANSPGAHPRLHRSSTRSPTLVVNGTGWVPDDEGVDTMNWGFFARVVLGIALVVGVIALGAGIYQAGFTAGVATEGNVAVAPAVYAATATRLARRLRDLRVPGLPAVPVPPVRPLPGDRLGRSRAARVRPGLGSRLRLRAVRRP